MKAKELLPVVGPQRDRPLGANCEPALGIVGAIGDMQKGP